MSNAMLFALFGLCVSLGGAVLERTFGAELVSRLMYCVGALLCGVGIGLAA